MATCEKCWSDAGGDALRYRDLLRERDERGEPCTPEERCGERHTIHPFEGRCECGLRTAPPAMVLP